jgi:hypothetical protein
MLAGCFFALMDGVNVAKERPGAPPQQVLAQETISILLDGVRPRC